MKEIILDPVDMTPEVMQALEDRGLIIRLCPNRHELNVEPGTARSESLYESDPKYGGHKLITVTVDRTAFTAFGTHPDNEEFLLIGDSDTKPLYLAVSLCRREELDRKVAAGDVSPDDFVCLRVKYKDPEVSFFAMLADVPHGEAVAATEGRPPSFYVTEPCGMGISFTDFRDFKLKVS